VTGPDMTGQRGTGGAAGFSSDTERILDNARQLDGLAGTAEAIAAELIEAVRAAGECWGTDQVGRGFAAGHMDAAAATEAVVGSLPEQLADIGAKLAETAGVHRRADEEIATGLPRM